MSTKSSSEALRLLSEIKRLIMLFIAGLVISGVTAFPIETELTWGMQLLQKIQFPSSIVQWIELVYNGVRETNGSYPFIAYGTDWLAFAHLVIAIAFIGPLRDPVRNMWVIEFGLISCV